ncbi:hypothetical protein ACS0TY_009997 [Phlomoides rotata]
MVDPFPPSRISLPPLSHRTPSRRPELPPPSPVGPSRLHSTTPVGLPPPSPHRISLADIQFDSSIIGVGETCKAVICLEIAASRNKLDIKALAIQFGCVRLIPFVHRGLSLYSEII